MNDLNKTPTNWPRCLETQRNRSPAFYRHATSIEGDCPCTVLNWTVQGTCPVRQVQGRYRPTR